MKTKNIFRMLLVAAALLMGANNVKADETQVWPLSGDDTSSNPIVINANRFINNLTATSTIRVYCGDKSKDYWSITFNSNNQSPDFANFPPDQKWGVNWAITKDTNPDIFDNKSYIELECDNQTVNKLSNGGLTLNLMNIVVTSVTIVGQQTAPSTDDYITINAISHGYRTYVTTQAINFGGSQNIEGYYASEVSGNNVVFTKVTGVCASDVPLLLVKTGSGDCKLLKSSDTGTEPPTNFLHPGETVNGQGKVVNDSRQYVLTWHNNAPVFAETNVNAARVDAEHAYLVLPSNASGRLRISFKHDDDDLTGIQSLQSDERSLDRAVYNLRGQRVEHPTKGIYIINGKKVIIK